MAKAQTPFGRAGIQYPVRVLFLCTGNSARSQIAEALLAHKGGDRFLVASAGAEPNAEVKPEAIEALRVHGIEWTGHTPKGLDAVLDQEWDFVITLCDRIKETCPALPSRPVTAHWGVPDPAEATDLRQRTLAFANTLNLLSWRIDLMLAIRLDQFESLILEQRLQHIAEQTQLPREPQSDG